MENREIKFRAWHKRLGIMYKDVHLLGTFNELLQNDTYQCLQFTGLHDKNGKEIYEGDIVSDGHSNNFIIKWFQSECQFGAEYTMEPEFAFQEIGDWCEIIGNIYEHPELLNLISDIKE